jgi:hypothetical protein
MIFIHGIGSDIVDDVIFDILVYNQNKKFDILNDHECEYIHIHLILTLNDLDWIILLFFIYPDALWVKKLEESTCRAILMTSPNLEIWAKTNHLKSSRSILRHQTTLFLWSKPYYRAILYIIYIDTFPTMQESPKSEFICECYASRKLTCHIHHHGLSGCHANLRYLKMWG